MQIHPNLRLWQHIFSYLWVRSCRFSRQTGQSAGRAGGTRRKAPRYGESPPPPAPIGGAVWCQSRVPCGGGRLWWWPAGPEVRIGLPAGRSGRSGARPKGSQKQVGRSCGRLGGAAASRSTSCRPRSSRTAARSNPTRSGACRPGRKSCSWPGPETRPMQPTHACRAADQPLAQLDHAAGRRAAGPVRRPERRPVFMRFCTIWLHDTGNHRNIRRC